VDPINPIAPGQMPISRLPVEPLERITRERDRPTYDAERRRRREAPPMPDTEEDDEGEDEDGRPRIDVRA
jgi:hypothetical protein